MIERCVDGSAEGSVSFTVRLARRSVMYQGPSGLSPCAMCWPWGKSLTVSSPTTRDS